jgi:hypothetical protein
MTIATRRPLITGPMQHAEGQGSAYEGCGIVLLGAPLSGSLLTSPTYCNKHISPNQHSTHARGESVFPQEHILFLRTSS